MIDYFTTIVSLLERLRESQLAPMQSAAELCAESIGGGKLVHLFGTGHGSLPALEAFPRSGSLVGFHPIVETPIALIHHVFGDMGVSQYRFLHRQEGYGVAILNSHQLADGDTLILFSHSGVNAVIIDMALEAKRHGLPVIGVTSVPHSSSVKSRHSSGKRLMEVADVTIDTGAPLGDAAVSIEGLPNPVAPVSTVLAVAVMDGIISETARVLVARGTPPHVELNLNLPLETSAREHNDRGYAELRQRLGNR